MAYKDVGYHSPHSLALGSSSEFSRRRRRGRNLRIPQQIWRRNNPPVGQNQKPVNEVKEKSVGLLQ